MADFDIYTNYKTILTVNVLIFSEGKVLLLKRAANKKIDPNLYAGIGGKVEPHEDFYSALYREVEEETGIKELKSIRLYSVTQHPFPPTDSEWVNIYFIASIEKQIPIPKSDDGEFFWFDPKVAEKLPMASDMKEYFKILNKNPNAFILGYFDHDQDGNVTEKKLNILD
ncbi:MAG: NUDIX domain-containing protein [Candidatus Shapirobacteria bacterium]|jgi:8-oxo-dGTP diphosphatase